MPWKNGNPPLYHVWRNMIERCYRKTSKQYHDYGGRGITVCDEWRTSYQQWFTDMGPRPTGNYSLDRIDNNKGYSKENCRWATKSEQQRNQRVTRLVNIEGITYVAAGLAEISGLKTDTIVERAEKGLTYKEVIDPVKKHNLRGFALGGKASGAKRKAKTHCKYGHEYTPENTRIEIQRGKYEVRVCRACHRKENKSRS